MAERKRPVSDGRQAPWATSAVSGHLCRRRCRWILGPPQALKRFSPPKLKKPFEGGGACKEGRALQPSVISATCPGRQHVQAEAEGQMVAGKVLVGDGGQVGDVAWVCHLSRLPGWGPVEAVRRV